MFLPIIIIIPDLLKTDVDEISKILFFIIRSATRRHRSISIDRRLHPEEIAVLNRFFLMPVAKS
jgi:hypothetical protein